MTERIPLNYPSSTARATDKGRTPNTDFPPFVAKTKIKVKDSDSYVPLYTPYDATDRVQGVSWLTDGLTVKTPVSESDNKSARTGMTAMTPHGVRKNALCVAYRDGNSILLEGNGQTNLSFQGWLYSNKFNTTEAMVSGTLTASTIKAKNISVSGSVDMNPMVKVNFLKTGTDASGNSTWKASGATSVKKDGYFNIDLDFDTLPADRLPAKIPSSHIEITQDMLPNIPLEKLPASVMERVILVNSHAEMLNLGTDKIQDGDAVKINNLPGTTEEGYAGKIYVVINDKKLGTDEAFTEFSAGTASKSAEADHATLADKAKAIDHSVTINFTKDACGSFSTDFADIVLGDVELTIDTIEKDTIATIFGVTLD